MHPFNAPPSAYDLCAKFSFPFRRVSSLRRIIIARKCFNSLSTGRMEKRARKKKKKKRNEYKLSLMNNSLVTSNIGCNIVHLNFKRAKSASSERESRSISLRQNARTTFHPRWNISKVIKFSFVFKIHPIPHPPPYFSVARYTSRERERELIVDLQDKYYSEKLDYRYRHSPNVSGRAAPRGQPTRAPRKGASSGPRSISPPIQSPFSPSFLLRFIPFGEIFPNFLPFWNRSYFHKKF